MPWVLLGLRAAPKEDSGLWSAEMVYGVALMLPGQFLAAQKPPAEQFVVQLQEALSSFQPTPTRPPPPRPAVPQELLDAKYVYVRCGNPGSSLEPLFDGPFAMVAAGGKVFKVRMRGREETVTVDRLKPHFGVAVPDVAVLPKRKTPLGARVWSWPLRGGGSS